MNIEESRQDITINRLVNTKKETITIEGDIIVPDIKPDILNTISTTGNVCILKKEVQEGKIKIDGTIDLNVIYLADSDSDTIRGLKSSLDFTKNIELENCKNEMNLKTNIIIKDIECKVLNGRKINIKVILNVELSVYSNEEIKILKEISNLEDIQVLKKNVQINNLIGNGSCLSTARDSIVLEENEKFGEILKTEIKITNKESKVSYNKVLLKADSNVKIMYLTEDNQIKMRTAVIPVMGFIDMNNISEESLITSNYEIKNIFIEANTEEKQSINIEIEFKIDCEALDSSNIELIEDMYSPIQDLQFNKKEIQTITNKSINRSIFKVREKVVISDVSNSKIYDANINTLINNVNILNGRIIYEGEIELTFMISSNNNIGIDTKKAKIPFTFNIDNSQISTEMLVNTKINYLDDEFTINSDGTIDCKVDLEFETEIYNNTNIRIIDEIKLEEERNIALPSMVVYIVKEGDTLWSIAKKYKTTIDEIVCVNKIEDPDKLSVGQKLFIPRYCTNKIA